MSNVISRIIISKHTVYIAIIICIVIWFDYSYQKPLFDSYETSIILTKIQIERFAFGVVLESNSPYISRGFTMLSEVNTYKYIYCDNGIIEEVNPNIKDKKYCITSSRNLKKTCEYNTVENKYGVYFSDSNRYICYTKI